MRSGPTRCPSRSRPARTTSRPSPVPAPSRASGSAAGASAPRPPAGWCRRGRRPRPTTRARRWSAPTRRCSVPTTWDSRSRWPNAAGSGLAGQRPQRPSRPARPAGPCVSRPASAGRSSTGVRGVRGVEGAPPAGCRASAGRAPRAWAGRPRCRRCRSRPRSRLVQRRAEQRRDQRVARWGRVPTSSSSCAWRSTLRKRRGVLGPLGPVTAVVGGHPLPADLGWPCRARRTPWPRSACRSSMVRLYAMCTGTRFSTATASGDRPAHLQQVTHDQRDAEPRTVPGRPPKASEIARPASFFPSTRPHRQSPVPISRRPVKAME